jgi:hypothetical protein
MPNNVIEQEAGQPLDKPAPMMLPQGKPGAAVNETPSTNEPKITEPGAKEPTVNEPQVPKSAEERAIEALKEIRESIKAKEGK